MISRSIKMLEVSVAEAPQQQATFRSKIPLTEEELLKIEETPIRIKPSNCLGDN
jgi:hypothetical protein